MIKFLYGFGKDYIDVTDDVLKNCLHDTEVFIPAGDTGARFFADPLPGVMKGMFVIRETRGGLRGQFYSANESITITLSEEERASLPVSDDGQSRTKRIVLPPQHLSNEERLTLIHRQLKFTGGNLRDEWVEQFNTLDFLRPSAKVLELGSSVGRNTLVMSCILADESNLVTLECNPDTVDILRVNREINNFRFHIEPAALSYRKLMYNRELELTVPSAVLHEGYEWVNTITFEQLVDKYAIEFDTLVADCEGALYYILQDNEQILKNIDTIILESDYRVAGQKWAVEAVFKKHGFEMVKWWSLAAGDTSGLPQECIDSFWEVWQKPNP